MSGINGDKARFHRERKQKIARRLRNRAQFKNFVVSKPSAAANATVKKQKEVSA